MKIKLSYAILFAFAFSIRSETLEPFPLAQMVREGRSNLTAAVVKPTGLKRDDYLKVISGIVNYFKHFQTSDGRIIDPFLHREVQYSTPCYAWAAATLIASGKETNLLDSAALALERAVCELAEDKAADNHGDFFTFPLVFAYETLRDRIPVEQRQRIEASFKAMDPQQCYNDLIREKRTSVHNWNVVALSGEFLREQNEFTDLAFVEKYLPLQLKYFTAQGLYRDPNTPMAYDHFPRHFLAAILERGYDGAERAELEELLQRAAWTSLFMQSPLGELPTGGRSAQHQWNEAEQCVTYEIWARRSERANDELGAKAFKRAAHLSLESVQRWVRSSGELSIVKNRFDPAVRHGFEGYSSHSQYNLLTASMLATAWHFADETIPEGACPADVGGFVFAIPEMHKIFANASGMYLEIDTAADPHYNSTGLIRVHKSGVGALVGPSDSTPIKGGALATGIAWLGKDGWHSLAEMTGDKIKGAKLTVTESKTNLVKFAVRYELNQPDVTAMIENYEVTPDQIRVASEVQGDVSKIKVRFPALAFDGENAAQISINGAQASVALSGSHQTFTVESEAGIHLQRNGQWISCRNGFLEAIEGEISGQRVVYTLRPEMVAAPLPKKK